VNAKYITAILLFLLAASGVDGSDLAVRISETPVQSAMQAEMARDNLTPTALWSQDWDDEFEGSGGQSSAGGKSVFKAGLLSALIPGGGQYYLGKRKTARYFFAAEALTWLSYFSFRTYGNWKKDDYQAYAAIHANADLEDKSDEFLTWVGFYSNIREFNQFGRAWDPERPYLPDTPENHWEWQTEEERLTYRDLRNGSKESYRRSEFMIGLAILDRAVAVIDAVRSARRMKYGVDGELSKTDKVRRVILSVNPLSTRRQVCLTIYPGF
jgi:hypothetical protein